MRTTIKATLPRNFLSNAGAIPAAAQKRLRVELKTYVQPALQKDVDRVIAPYPAQRVPWGNGFGTDKSRRWYFANMVGKGSRSGHYQRTGAIKDSWVVLVNPVFADNTIAIRNLRPESIYVYGPRQIPGHKKTGFAKDFPEKMKFINGRIEVLSSEAWLRSVQYAVQNARK